MQELNLSISMKNSTSFNMENQIKSFEHACEVLERTPALPEEHDHQDRFEVFTKRKEELYSMIYTKKVK